jgi:hypothetical protein
MRTGLSCRAAPVVPNRRGHRRPSLEIPTVGYPGTLGAAARIASFLDRGGSLAGLFGGEIMRAFEFLARDALTKGHAGD